MTLSDPNDPHRKSWESLWRETIWECCHAGRWSLIDVRSAVPLVVITAWNPGGLRLLSAVNHARDAVLYRELSARGLAPCRARGRSPSSDWVEEGWQFPHEESRTAQLLWRYGQIAGWVTDADGAHLHWSAVVPPR